jgi:hypothetical protein
MFTSQCPIRRCIEAGFTKFSSPLCGKRSSSGLMSTVLLEDAEYAFDQSAKPNLVAKSLYHFAKHQLSCVVCRKPCSSLRWNDQLFFLSCSCLLAYLQLHFCSNSVISTILSVMRSINHSRRKISSSPALLNRLTFVTSLRLGITRLPTRLYGSRLQKVARMMRQQHA